MTDTIRKAAFGDEEQFPWKDRFPPYVERVVIYMWCNRIFTLGEVIAITMIALGLGGWLF